MITLHIKSHHPHQAPLIAVMPLSVLT